MTSRKDFIAATAALAAAPQLAGAATPAPKAPDSPAIPKLNFDLAAFNAILANDVPHKHLFADRKIAGGSGLGAVRSTLNAYKDIGVPASDIATAIVLYHGPSICIAMDDHVWSTYLLPVGAAMKKSSPEIAKDFATVVDSKTKGNPLLRPQPSDENTSVQALTADGLRFFVCNNALKGFATLIGHEKGMKPADVYADISRHLVPNTTVVPAGVWAIQYSQEKKYTLLQT